MLFRSRYIYSQVRGLERRYLGTNHERDFVGPRCGQLNEATHKAWDVADCARIAHTKVGGVEHGGRNEDEYCGREGTMSKISPSSIELNPPDPHIGFAMLKSALSAGVKPNPTMMRGSCCEVLLGSSLKNK